MIFGGLRKLTLLDFPTKTACTLFTKGCNYRCPFCHNASLVTHTEDAEQIDSAEVIAFLKKRIGVLDGVAITGGEPLMYNELYDFIKEVKSLGFLVKLDTNGSFPDRLKRLIDDGLLNYVAMDIKNSRELYDVTIGVTGMLAKVEQSIEILKNSSIDYEFRTTVVNEFHDPSVFADIAQWLQGAKHYYLQVFTDSGDLIGKGMHAMSKDDMLLSLNNAKKYIPQAEIRGDMK